MADLKVLMVADGARFNFGPRQNPTGPEDDNYFGVSTLCQALQNSTTPTFQVDFAHRRGYTFTGQTAEHEDCSANLTYPGDFVFALASPAAPHTVSADLSEYDVLWLIGDEGFNSGTTLATDSEITDPENIAIANFMEGGGGVFAVGDHDGIGAYMCGKLPRVRVMRRWFEWDHPQTDPASGQQFIPNWSAEGFDSAQPAKTDRNDTLRPDASDGQFYFFDQSDPTAQPLLDSTGAPLPSMTGPVHTILRDAVGAVIAQFPDHMHEGEATDFSTVASPPFNPNQSPGTPYKVTYTDANGHPVAFEEFPLTGGYQPQPEVIAYDSDTGHATFYQSGDAFRYATTQPKRRGVASVYDGHAVGVGRVVTGCTFHHYLDKNLIGDPGTASNTPSGLSVDGLTSPVVSGMQTFYVNVATWLARPDGSFVFLTLKNTFGKDEVSNAASHGQSFTNAFYVMIDGYTPNQVGAMPAITLSGPFAAAVTTAGFQQGAAIPEDAGSPDTPQRVLIPFTINTIPGSAFPTGAAPLVLVLEARATINGTPHSAEALFELVAGADPYFSNLGSDQGDEWYLSQDLRVFQAGPGAPSTPFVPYPSSGSAYDYITSLLAHLNNPVNGYTNGSTDPFATLSQANDLTEASSVTPNTQNFAVARVRLRGSSGTPASNVKVFFRLWEAASNDTDYDAQTTYVSTYDSANLPDKPLAAPGGLNSPLFASGPAGGGDYDPGVNQLNLTVGSSTAETWAYFGCYLDVYNNPAVTLIGTHHCLVAQIAYDGAPIVGSTGVTLSPENSDKLAQRNIQVTPSGNPGGPATHLVSQAFDLRSSVRVAEPVGTLAGYPDELMIDWGEVPRGSVASIYWPQADAIDVVRLAMLLQGTDLLRVADAHTVQCRVASRLTYVPIPYGAGANLAGLLSIQLPQGVRKGQEFQVVVRRISTRRTGKIQLPGTEVSVAAGKPILSTRSGRRPNKLASSRAAAPITRDWRYVVGTFKVTIPVELDDVLLRPEENTLAILKWRLQQMSTSDRWYPVLKRYVGDVSGRVAGFGGNPVTILPSPTGLPCGGGVPHPEPCPHDLEEFTGKICEVIYGCFGEFEGFVLDTCKTTRAFASRDRSIGELALRVCRDRLTVSVLTELGGHHRIVRILVKGF